MSRTVVLELILSMTFCSLVACGGNQRQDIRVQTITHEVFDGICADVPSWSRYPLASGGNDGWVAYLNNQNRYADTLMFVLCEDRACSEADSKFRMVLESFSLPSGRFAPQSLEVNGGVSRFALRAKEGAATFVYSKVSVGAQIVLVGGYYYDWNEYSGLFEAVIHSLRRCPLSPAKTPSAGFGATKLTNEPPGSPK